MEIKNNNAQMNYAFKASRRHEIDSELEKHNLSGGGIFSPAKLDVPRGKIHHTQGEFFVIYPGRKTPCECFQAEKVVVVGGKHRLLQ